MAVIMIITACRDEEDVYDVWTPTASVDLELLSKHWIISTSTSTDQAGLAASDFSGKFQKPGVLEPPPERSGMV